MPSMSVITWHEGRVGASDGLRQHLREGPAGHGPDELGPEGGGVAVGLRGGVDNHGAEGQQTATRTTLVKGRGYLVILSRLKILLLLLVKIRAISNRDGRL